MKLSKINLKLLTSSKLGQVKEVTQLLTRKTINPNCEDEFGRTPLCFACENGHHEIVKLLFNDQRVDINQAQNDGSTPFLMACVQGHTEVVKLFLNDERAELNKANEYGTTGFLLSCQEKNIEVLKLLLNNERIDCNQAMYSGETPLSMACESNRFQIARRLLNSGRVDLNQVNYDGQSVFWLVCSSYGGIETMELLLNDQRVDVNKAETKRGTTPFMQACLLGRFQVVKYMLASRKEINVNAKDNNGKTAIEMTREKRKTEEDEVELFDFLFDEEDEVSTMERRFLERDWMNTKKNLTNIIKLLLAFEKNPDKTRKVLRKQLALDGNRLFQ